LASNSIIVSGTVRSAGTGRNPPDAAKKSQALICFGIQHFKQMLA
jgi:hypothetical protein